jgi:predicted TIM-barrel fold metal-dependent hydrolase
MTTGNIVRVLDSHVHFWNADRLRYPWIERGSAFDRGFVLPDYLRTCAQAQVGVAGLIFVEADADSSCSLHEARWAQELAADPRIRGMVARVALTESRAVAADLDALAAMPLVRGIRDNIQGHSPGFALQRSFVQGVREVGRRGMHFELCLQHPQLAETIELARRCPDVPLVLDHCAKPGIRGGEREPWLTQIRQLAALPNIVCKVSGLMSEAAPDRWQPEEILWYARQAADAFGPDRILFGSDWPVCEAAGGFEKWFRVAQTLAAPWSAGDRESFFWRNAERVYRLD